MTDASFQKLLDELSKAHHEYLVLLAKGHKEYNRRFGHYPGDVDDDFWIDTFEANGGGSATVEQVTDNAKIHNLI